MSRPPRKPSWELRPTTRFNNRAALYAKYRPTYPPEAIDAVLAQMPRTDLPVAADLGAGTGILSRLIADWGISVKAVEPNREMREAAAPHTGVRWVDAPAESTTLADNAAHLVTCGQAWHWFEPEKACAEVARILKPGGVFALLWYDDKPGCPASAMYRKAVKPGASETFGMHDDEQWSPTLAPPFDNAAAEHHIFEYEHRLDLEGLFGRARSASYVPQQGPDADRVEERMRELHAKHAGDDGIVTLGLICVVHILRLGD